MNNSKEEVIRKEVLKRFENAKEILIEEKEDGSIEFTAIGKKEKENE
jgi:hypothetical protein